MRGRKAAGPELVHQLTGAAATKQRAEWLLQTLAGELPVHEAARRLGVTPQHVHTLRERALQGLLVALAPRPLGRPRPPASVTPAELAALRAENERLRQELAVSQLREEIALLLPGRPESARKKNDAGAAARDGVGRRGLGEPGGGSVGTGAGRGPARGRLVWNGASPGE